MRSSERKSTARMRSEEAKIGRKVRVRPEHRRPEFRDRRGTIEQRYGSSDYAALEVRFDDGDTQLFWYYELDEVEDAPGRRYWWRTF